MIQKLPDWVTIPAIAAVVGLLGTAMVFILVAALPGCAGPGNRMVCRHNALAAHLLSLDAGAEWSGIAHGTVGGVPHAACRSRIDGVTEWRTVWGDRLVVDKPPKWDALPTWVSVAEHLDRNWTGWR